MDNQKLARSLTAEDTALLPHLPYLLQDLWNFGTPAEPLISLVRRHIPDIAGFRVLDLGCGKGAVGLPLSLETGAAVHFVDAFAEFIEYAKMKAAEMKVENCTFSVEDVAQTVQTARSFDMVLLCGVGNIFGNADATVKALKQTVRKGGYIVIEDTYYAGENQPALKCACDCGPLNNWLDAFAQNGVQMIEQLDDSEFLCDEANNDFNNRHIARRAMELSEKHPEKKSLFDGYVQSQLNECDDLKTLCGAIWLLKVSSKT
jgi:SAM-dependent methyltransferase